MPARINATSSATTTAIAGWSGSCSQRSRLTPGIPATGRSSQTPHSGAARSRRTTSVARISPGSPAASSAGSLDVGPRPAGRRRRPPSSRVTATTRAPPVCCCRTTAAANASLTPENTQRRGASSSRPPLAGDGRSACASKSQRRRATRLTSATVGMLFPSADLRRGRRSSEWPSNGAAHPVDPSSSPVAPVGHQYQHGSGRAAVAVVVHCTTPLKMRCQHGSPQISRLVASLTGALRLERSWTQAVVAGQDGVRWHWSG